MTNHLPALNALLNLLSAIFLTLGFFLIRRKNVHGHRLAMTSAFTTSTLFLIGYITYHVLYGVVRYQGIGWRRPAYLTLLTTHTILAIVILPMVLRTLYLALSKRFHEHRRLARWTLPLWFYVSVTGVIIYEILY